MSTEAVTEEIFEDWEILSCKLHYGWREILFYYLIVVLLALVTVGQMGTLVLIAGARPGPFGKSLQESL